MIIHNTEDRLIQLSAQNSLIWSELEKHGSQIFFVQPTITDYER